MIAIKDREIRGWDKHGNGKYQAKRGSRMHNGVDFISDVDEQIPSPVTGTVSKIGYPYNPQSVRRGHLRYVQVTDENGIKNRVFYIKPTVEIGDKVEEGDCIGISQDLDAVYPGITQHVHFEVKKNSRYLNPMKYLYNN